MSIDSKRTCSNFSPRKQYIKVFEYLEKIRCNGNFYLFMCSKTNRKCGVLTEISICSFAHVH